VPSRPPALPPPDRPADIRARAACAPTQTFHFLSRPTQHPGPVNQTFKQFYRISRTEPLAIDAVAPDAHEVLATPRPLPPTGADMFGSARTPRGQTRPGQRGSGDVPEHVVVSNVARDYIAVKAATGETRATAALPEVPALPPSPAPPLQPRVQKPMSPLRLGPRPEPLKQWEPGPLLDKYGITQDEALHPREAFRVTVAHLDADATLMVGGVSPKALHAEPSTESLVSRSSTPTFAIKQRIANSAAAAGNGVGPDEDPAHPDSLSTSMSADVLRPMVPSKPQAPRTGAYSSRIPARLPNSGRWNAQAHNNTGPGSHAAHRLAATRRGRVLRGIGAVGPTGAGMSSIHAPPTVLPAQAAMASPRLPSLRRHGQGRHGAMMQTA
jgi:hypothetical protein